MRIRSDHDIPRHNKSSLRKKGVLDSHLPYIKIVRYLMLPGILTYTLAVFRRLDILVRDKMIHDQGDLVLIKHLIAPELIHLSDCDRSGNIISQYQVQVRLDQISRMHLCKSCGVREYFLSHCHSHRYGSSNMIAITDSIYFTRIHPFSQPDKKACGSCRRR